MSAADLNQDSFILAAGDPYLSALIGTIEEPGGSTNATQAGRLTLAWWDRHGTGPSCAELIDAVFSSPNWDDITEDPTEPCLNAASRPISHRWLISYWSRLGAIAYIPGHDDPFGQAHPRPHLCQLLIASAGSMSGGRMREIIIGDRTIVVTMSTPRQPSTATSRTTASTWRARMPQRRCLSCARAAPSMHASWHPPSAQSYYSIRRRSAEHGLLRNSGVREWRDENRGLIEDAWERLQSEIAQPPRARRRRGAHSPAGVRPQRT